MSQFHSDLVGARGDLVFPALHALVKRGRPHAPVIAGARGDCNLEQLQATANESVKTHGGGAWSKSVTRHPGSVLALE